VCEAGIFDIEGHFTPLTGSVDECKALSKAFCTKFGGYSNSWSSVRSRSLIFVIPHKTEKGTDMLRNLNRNQLLNGSMVRLVFALLPKFDDRFASQNRCELD
jgi:hypothetical protein